MFLLILSLLLLATGTQTTPAVGGVWTLNRTASDMPREIGFNVEWLQTPSGDGSSSSGASGGSRGRRCGGGGGGGRTPAFTPPRESYDDARRVQFLTGEARNPPTRITVVDTPDAITITNELGQSRTLHPNGQTESIEVSGVPLIVSTKRDGDKIVVTYTVDNLRQVRYTYTLNDKPSQLLVDVQFIEKGSGDKGRLVYEPGTA